MRPIPIDVIPSHVYLSQDDQATLFGIGQPMTIFQEHTQVGQLIYREMVAVKGKLKRTLDVRVMGPNWAQSQAHITPTEAVYLGLTIEQEVKAGDLSESAPGKLIGPKGEVELKAGIIIPQPHLLCSPEEAEALHISNGDIITAETIAESSLQIENIIVRVHPTYRLRIEMHQDHARDLWIVRPIHARIV